MPGDALVRVVRSGLEESIHAVDVAVVDEEGALVAFAGDAERLAFARSCMKPLQASVALSLAPFDFSDAEVAVMCASHNAEPVHLAAVRGILARAGVAESSLLCPTVRPWDEGAALAAPEPMPINSDCSGKHAGMLAACAAQTWPQATYRDPGHPLQRAIREVVLCAGRMADCRVGVDGCGVPVHGFPLRSMASVYASLARPERLDSLAAHAVRAVAGMVAQPYLVAGRNRVDTAVMERAGGRVIVKAGAEGMMCAAALDRGLGLALKVRDGTQRATGPALVAALRALDVLDDADVEAMAAYASPPVLGGGRPVGAVEAMVDLKHGP
jgi:L-asparaginase II